MLLKTKQQENTFCVAQKKMGNHFEITAIGVDEKLCADAIAAAYSEIDRIENLLSTYKADSDTNKINDNAGCSAVKVQKETFELIERAQNISKLTDGAFDLSYGSLDKSFWNFDRNMKKLPDTDTALGAVRLINYKNIQLDAQEKTVLLKEKGMRIGFGGIGKGYAAEKAKNIMHQMGITSGLVNASGDISAWGAQDQNATGWKIGISNPENPSIPYSTLTLRNNAIATSGNYEKYVMIKGKKYSHTINPKTGLPITGIKSVTIIAPNAELADALATPVTIMGIQTGLNFVNQLPGVECLLIDDSNKLHASKNLNITN